MKKLFLFLTLAILLPSAIAFSCNSLSGGDLQICNSIQNTNLSQSDKDLYISDLFNKNKTTPDFDFVYQWNTNLNIANSPDGKVYSSGTIGNTWVKIVSLMPSIIENHTLYASDNGKLLTAYNYQFGNLPSKTESQDCKTYYSWDTQSSNINIYLNNNLIGSSKITAYQVFNSPDNLDFRVELNIKARYKVEHYRRIWYGDYEDCGYYSTEYRTDSLTLSDTLSAKLYKNQINSSFKITNKYNQITKGFLEAYNYSNLILSFNNSEYKNQKYIYSFNYSLPYYALTIRAETADITSSRNIHVEKTNSNISFNVVDTSNCKITISDFFTSKTLSCDLSFNQTNFSIKTDKTNYFDNETIKIYVYPDNLSVNLTYANKTIIVKNYTEIKSVLYENRITARLADKEEVALVNVNKKEDFDILYQLSLFFFFGYIYYRTTKNYAFKFLEAI